MRAATTTFIVINQEKEQLVFDVGGRCRINSGSQSVYGISSGGLSRVASEGEAQGIGPGGFYNLDHFTVGNMYGH